MKSPKLRFGCHDFINSMPFTYPLKEGLVEHNLDIMFAPPAELARQLQEGLLDIAFIPSIEYARIKELMIVPGFGIASQGAVTTVALFSKSEISEIKEVRVDPRSRTSVALLEILFDRHYKKKINITYGTGDPASLHEDSDAFLMIGDEAFKLYDAGYHIYDLSDAWLDMTGKPFVFAILCVAGTVNAEDAISTLKKAKEEGMKNIDDICKKVEKERGISADICRDYLLSRIRYDLDKNDLAGLKLFFKEAIKSGIIKNRPDLVFYS